jgi:glycosyltransferase involved in cell wall biosynthesis
MQASIIIRTYNEARRLPEVLDAIAAQEGVPHEVLLVDSGSTDRTVEIAERHGCRIERIAKADFSFGRSLNLGCRAARGRFLVFVSGHCVPVGRRWLARLLEPLAAGRVALSYGRQVGGEDSRFSECRIFEKYFPAQSRIPQEGFFCNNANAALPRDVWEKAPFDEELTGLEDMHLGQRLAGLGQAIGYVAEAEVRHLHDESWGQVRNRFEREALALRHIMPEVQLTRLDVLRYFLNAVAHDGRDALRAGRLWREAGGIVLYRLMQYWGAHRGNHLHREMSRSRKERYYYPR